MWPWISHLISLGFSNLICKIGIVTDTISLLCELGNMHEGLSAVLMQSENAQFRELLLLIPSAP